MEGKADALVAVLYLTKNGLLEPLGQSQILPYLRGLSNKYKFTLVTYEKLEDRQILCFNKGGNVMALDGFLKIFKQNRVTLRSYLIFYICFLLV